MYSMCIEALSFIEYAGTGLPLTQTYSVRVMNTEMKVNTFEALKTLRSFLLFTVWKRAKESLNGIFAQPGGQILISKFQQRMFHRIRQHDKNSSCHAPWATQTPSFYPEIILNIKRYTKLKWLLGSIHKHDVDMRFGQCM